MLADLCCNRRHVVRPIAQTRFCCVPRSAELADKFGRCMPLRMVDEFKEVTRPTARCNAMWRAVSPENVEVLRPPSVEGGGRVKSTLAVHRFEIVQSRCSPLAQTLNVGMSLHRLLHMRCCFRLPSCGCFGWSGWSTRRRAAGRHAFTDRKPERGMEAAQVALGMQRGITTPRSKGRYDCAIPRSPCRHCGCMGAPVVEAQGMSVRDVGCRRTHGWVVANIIVITPL